MWMASSFELRYEPLDKLTLTNLYLMLQSHFAMLLGCKLQQRVNVCFSLQLLMAVRHTLHSSFRWLQCMWLIKHIS